ncbi:MAG TPA: AtpZ/AtpI family protein [Candidatus Obscuribacterales bacterium]
MSKNNPDEKPGSEDKDKKKSLDVRNMLVASQFAYTLVIATELLGYAGYWLGNQLGGEPWNIILMLVLGGFAFAGEVYRMIRMFSVKKDELNNGGPGAPSGSNESDKDGSESS